MNIMVLALGLGLVWGNGFLLQQPSGSAAQDPSQQSTQPSGVQQFPVSPIGTPMGAVQITNGPVVENVTDTTAEIAWSTNVNSGTALHYGTDSGHLEMTASMPWGGLTHRVLIKNLQPNTTYYFKAESGQGQGTGTQAQTAQASFQTKAVGTTSQLR